LTGLKFNKLTVSGRADNLGRQPAWHCVCECGGAKVVRGSHLRDGTAIDCGCGTHTRRRDSKVRHGMTGTPEWGAWKSMLDRCTNPNHPSWGRYGGRGIVPCKRWLKFENFYADMGPRPDGTSLDRIDNDKGYTPKNCRWATQLQQHNNKSSNVHMTIDGVTRTISEWARHFGIKYSVVKTRYAKGITGIELFAASPRKPYGRRIEFDGELLTITQIAKRLNVPYLQVWKRFNSN